MDLADHFVGEAVNQTADSEQVDLLEQAKSPYQGQNGSWEGEEKQQEVNFGRVAEMIQQAIRQDGADLIARAGQICLIRLFWQDRLR